MHIFHRLGCILAEWSLLKILFFPCRIVDNCFSSTFLRNITLQLSRFPASLTIGFGRVLTSFNPPKKVDGAGGVDEQQSEVKPIELFGEVEDFAGEEGGGDEYDEPLRPAFGQNEADAFDEKKGGIAKGNDG